MDKEKSIPLVCSLCNEKLQQPQILDCLHNYCQKCLQKMQESTKLPQQKLRCPICQQITEIKSGGGTLGTKTNFFLVRLVEEATVSEILRNKSAKVSCGLCQQDAMSQCYNCAVFLCPTCEEFHGHLPAASSNPKHDIFSQEECRSGNPPAELAGSQDKALECQKHATEKCRFFCEKCQELICTDCTIIDHSATSHRYTNLEAAAPAGRQSAKDLLVQVEKRLPDLETSLQVLGKMGPELENRSEEARARVQVLANKIREAVTAEEKRLLREICHESQQQTKELRETQKETTAILQRAQFSLEAARVFIRTSTDSEFLWLSSTLQRNLRCLSETTIPNAPAALRFVEDVSNIHLGKLEKEDIVEAVSKEVALENAKENRRRAAAVAQERANLQPKEKDASSEKNQPQLQFGQGIPTGGRRSSKKPKKVIKRVSRTVKLNTAGKNAWKPDKDMPADEEEAKTMDLFKKTKSLLNKLTPNNFQSLKEQAMSYPIDTEERLKGVIDLVFEKAISEKPFFYTKAYAQLCRDLSQLKVPAASGSGMVQFRTLLINRCQKEFEKERSNEQEKLEREKIAKLPADQRTSALKDLELKLIKNRQRFLGNMRFIGELFKLHMLIEQIMHDCIYKLLCSKDDESFECMCHLMTTIGKVLDHEKAKNRMNQYFNQIKNIIAQRKTSAKTRFLLQDIMDLRARNWVPLRADEHPKTIEQIRQDHKREEEQKKMKGIQAQLTAPQHISRGKRGQPRRVGPPQSEGWSTVTSTKATRVSVSPNKFKVTKQPSIDNDIQLGPGRQPCGGWSRGSSGRSSKMQENQDGLESRQSRRFMMLSDDRWGRGPAPTREQAKPAAAAPELSEEVFEKKATAIIDEYLNIRDIKETIACILELDSSSRMHILVRSAMNRSLETSAQARDLIGLLFHKLLKTGHLARGKFLEGVNEVLIYGEDMELDIPLIWKYLGEIIGSTFRDNSLSLSLLVEMMEPARAAQKAGDFMAEILLTAVKFNGASVVAEMWQSSGFTWDMFLPSRKDVEEFVNSKKLEFTLSAVGSGKTNSGGNTNANNVMTDEEWVSLIKRELGCILDSNENVNNDVFDWVRKNIHLTSPERERLFIRALVSAVVQSTIQGEAENCRLNHDLLAVRTAILKRYIDNKHNWELQALYVAQALNQQLVNPPRLLGFIFNVLYDEDVIPEETFYAWQRSTDPNEAIGRGVALKAVTSFFDWLSEGDDETPK